MTKRKWRDNTMTKRKRTTRKSKALRRKLNIEQHETHLKPWLISCAPEELVSPAPLVTPIVLLFRRYEYVPHIKNNWFVFSVVSS